MRPSHEPTLSTHVLDTERGRPAARLPVALVRREGSSDVPLATATTDADGRIGQLGSEPLTPGVYALTFDVAVYQQAQGDEATFLTRVVVEFAVIDDGRHYHVPLLLSLYACTTYRGS